MKTPSAPAARPPALAKGTCPGNMQGYKQLRDKPTGLCVPQCPKGRLPFRLTPVQMARLYPKANFHDSEFLCVAVCQPNQPGPPDPFTGYCLRDDGKLVHPMCPAGRLYDGTTASCYDPAVGPPKPASPTPAFPQLVEPTLVHSNKLLVTTVVLGALGLGWWLLSTPEHEP